MTHWLYLDELRARFPAVEVVDEGIFVQDRGVWTSAGAAAGIDLTLALVEEEHGHQVAMAVARRLVLFLRRSGNQAQFSSSLQRQEKEPPKLRNVSTFVLEHIDEPLPVERIAHGVGMSRLEQARRLLEATSLPLKDVTSRTGFGDQSTLWRVFTSSLGVTPAEYRERFAVAS
jgi:transcriptional regulator GlxA family with amidase domain